MDLPKAIELCKVLERYLKGMHAMTDKDDVHDGMESSSAALLATELMEEVWLVILVCDNTGRKALKSAPKEKNKKRQEAKRAHGSGKTQEGSAFDTKAL